MKRAALPFLAALALCSAAHPAAAQRVAWRLEPQATRLHFELRHFGTSTIRGRFDTLAASVVTDAAAGAGEVSVTVETASVSTGLAIFDKVIRGPDVLDAAAHPQAWYVAQRIEFADGRPDVLHGELTLRGISRPLVLRAERFACAPRPPEGATVCGGDFAGSVRRSDFGITYALPFAADEVRLVVFVEARPR